LASGDRLKVSFAFPEDAPPPQAALAPAPAPEPPPQVPAPKTHAPPPVETPEAQSSSHTGAAVAWVVTGLLVAGAATTGAFTLVARKDLSKQLGSYPGDPALIDHERRRTKTFATVTDLLLATGLVSAGIALYLSFPSQRANGATTVGLGFGPRGIELRGQY
jgi:hypothetical protein